MRISIRFAAIAAAALLAAVPQAMAQKIETLRVTYVASPFNVPSIVMRAKGYLDEAYAPMGIKV
ncbi:MAG: ABC transporter substrate-binding protein, partial [Alphaproteobacteria bacterium]|nr:ABC transporter substrate-binding protein [Alphaproteobacteria bacterium]